jgi:hypothetical protein
MIEQTERNEGTWPFRLASSEAVARTYPEAFSVCEGYVIINRSHLLVRISEGAARILKEKEANLLLETLEFVFPLSKKGQTYRELIESQFRELESAIEAREGEYYWRKINGDQDEISSFDVLAFDGTEISIAFTCKPLIINGDLFIVGFIDVEPSPSSLTAYKASEKQAEEVIRTETERRLEIANKLASTTGHLTNASFQWLIENVVGGSRLARIAAFLLVMGGVLSLAIVITVTAITIVKGPRFFAEIYYEFFRGIPAPQSVTPRTKKTLLFRE